MLFWRRNKRQEDVAAENEENLYPVVHVMNTLKEYEKEMVQKEVDSLWELNEIRGSFGTVLKETERFQERLADFEHRGGVRRIRPGKGYGGTVRPAGPG